MFHSMMADGKKVFLKKLLEQRKSKLTIIHKMFETNSSFDVNTLREKFNFYLLVQ